MSEWKEYKLSDLSDSFNQLRVPLNSIEREKRKGSIPYYCASGIIDYVDKYLFDGEYVLISEDGENLRTRKTPIAFDAKGKFWVNNHAHIIKGKKPHLNKFIIYLFKNIDLNPFLTGAVQPKLSKESLLSILFFLPEKETEQIAITEVLSSLDDKIDLLHRQNKTLEQLAETLFRQWFVEEAEESWENFTIGDMKIVINDFVANGSFASLKENVTLYSEIENYALFIRNTDLKNGFKSKVFVDKHSYEFLSKTKLFGGEVIISNVADVGSVFLCPKFERPMTLGNNVIMLNSEYNLFLYLYFKSSIGQGLINGITSGSAQQKFNKTDFRNSIINIPSINYLMDFNKEVVLFFDKIEKNQNQIRTLIELRDTLLPKLMSGEVRVKI